MSDLASGTKRGRILIAEPDEGTALDLKRRLEHFGYEVVDIAVNAEGLRAKAIETRPDLILSETILSGRGDGIAAAEEMGKAFGIPFVFVTGILDREAEDRVIASGPAAIITKRFKERDLHEALRLSLANPRRYASGPLISDAECDGIYIIEDEKIVALDYARRIERAGFPIAGIAENAEEGIPEIFRIKPALVSTGIYLGFGLMDGVDGARILRDSIRLPLIFCTAMSDEKTFARVAQVHPEAYITKPFKERDLLLTIRLALSRYVRKDKA